MQSESWASHHVMACDHHHPLIVIKYWKVTTVSSSIQFLILCGKLWPREECNWQIWSELQIRSLYRVQRRNKYCLCKWLCHFFKPQYTPHSLNFHSSDGDEFPLITVLSLHLLTKVLEGSTKILLKQKGASYQQLYFLPLPLEIQRAGKTLDTF